MVRIRDIVIDCANARSLARFWSEALSDYEIRAYDAAEIARLAALGLTPDTDPSVAIDGPGPSLFLQQVREPKTARNRVHLDLVGGDRALEIVRLRELGATIREEREGYTVMQDPEGNEFCVKDPD